MATFVLPGDRIDPSQLSNNSKHALRLGPGLRHALPGEIAPVTAGIVLADKKKKMAWLQQPSGKYVPTAGDVVIGTVQRSAAELYHVSLSDFTSTATLPQLAFEKATKKTKPNLSQGALVYARVVAASKHMDAELECVSQSTGRADGLGPLVGGMVFDISTAMARRMLLPRPVQDGKIVVLDELGSAGLTFESAIGHNGKVWINSEAISTVLIVGRALRQTDESSLTVQEQKKLVRKIIQSGGAVEP